MCNGAGSAQSAIYPDQRAASITSSYQGVVSFSVDLKDDGNGGTAGDYYTIYPAMMWQLATIKAWVDEGKAGCRAGA